MSELREPRTVFVVRSAAKGSRCYDDKADAEVDAEHYAPPAQVVEYVPRAELEAERAEHAKTRAWGFECERLRGQAHSSATDLLVRLRDALHERDALAEDLKLHIPQS